MFIILGGVLSMGDVKTQNGLEALTSRTDVPLSEGPQSCWLAKNLAYPPIMRLRLIFVYGLCTNLTEGLFISPKDMTRL